MQSTTSPANADDIDEDEDDFNEYPLDHIMTTPTASTTTPTKVSRANVVSQREHQKPSSIIGSDGTAKSTKSKNSRSNNPANDQNSIIRCILELASRGDLYKGVAPIITTTFISQFIFFFMNAYIKRFIFHGSLGTTNKLFSSASSKAILSLTTSCLAGIGNVLLTNPLWVTNMAIVNRKTETQNLVRELIGLIRARGWKHLWDGTGASILLVSNPIIQFFCYEQFKQLRLDHLVQKSKLQPTNLMGGAAPKVELRVVETFLLAALAKAIATVLTYPLQLTQTLLRLGDGVDDEDHCDASQSAAIVTKKQQLQKHPRYKGSYDCLYQLYRTKGITSWFTGMRAKMIQTVLTAAFTFLTYEQVLSAVQTVMRNELMISNHGSIPSRNHGNTSLKPEG
jgi:adenine nucleotide transporter 17